METLIGKLFIVLHILCGALTISESVREFQRGRYFLFGVSLMIAVWNAISMGEIHCYLAMR